MGNDLLFDCGIGILYRNWRLWQCIGLAFKCLVSWFFVATLQPCTPQVGVYIYKKYCSIPRNDLFFYSTHTVFEIIVNFIYLINDSLCSVYVCFMSFHIAVAACIS